MRQAARAAKLAIEEWKTEPMTRIKDRERCILHADSVEWMWLLLSLLATVAILLLLAHSTPVRAQGSEPHYVTNAVDTGSDCDQSQGMHGSHCHATVTCSAYAQLEANVVADNEMTNRHPLPIAQGVCIGQTLRPSLQPPKRFSHA
jgi:hypothetical protein